MCQELRKLLTLHSRKKKETRGGSKERVEVKKEKAREQQSDGQSASVPFDHRALHVVPLAKNSETMMTITTAPAIDRSGRQVLLFENDWSIRLATENNEGLKLAETADRTEADVLE